MKNGILHGILYILCLLFITQVALAAINTTPAAPAPPPTPEWTQKPVQQQGQAQGASGILKQAQAFYGQDHVWQQKNGVWIDTDGSGMPDLDLDQYGKVLNSKNPSYTGSFSTDGNSITFRQGQYITLEQAKDKPALQYDPALKVIRIDDMGAVTAIVDGQEETFGVVTHDKEGNVKTLRKSEMTVTVEGSGVVLVESQGKPAALYIGNSKVGDGSYTEGKLTDTKSGKLLASYDRSTNTLTTFDDKGVAAFKLFTEGSCAGCQVDLRDQKNGYSIVLQNGQRIAYCKNDCSDPDAFVKIEYTKGFLDCKKSHLSDEECSKVGSAISATVGVWDRFKSMARGAAAGQGLCWVLKLFKADCGDKIFKQYDEFMQQTVLGNVLSGDTSKLCQMWTKASDTNDIAITPSGGAAAWAAAEVTELKDPTGSNDTVSYLYKITFDVSTSGIVDSGCENKLVPFRIELDSDVLDINLNNDTSDDTIRVKCDGGGYRATGSRTIVRYYPKRYAKICIHFLDAEQLNSFFRKQLDNGRFCNTVAKGGQEYKGSRCTWCIFGSGSHPDEENPSTGVIENRPNVVNP